MTIEKPLVISKILGLIGLNQFEFALQFSYLFGIPVDREAQLLQFVQLLLVQSKAAIDSVYLRLYVAQIVFCYMLANLFHLYLNIIVIKLTYNRTKGSNHEAGFEQFQ